MYLMYDFFKGHQILKSENEKLNIKLLSIKKSDLDYKKINKNCIHCIKTLENH